MMPGQAEGRCGPVSWSLRWSSQEPQLRHLGREFLYRAPLPRTKLTSPAPRASFDGVLERAQRIELAGHKQRRAPDLAEIAAHGHSVRHFLI